MGCIERAPSACWNSAALGPHAPHTTDWEKPGCGETFTKDPRMQLLPLIALIGPVKSSWVWGRKVRNESPWATSVCLGHPSGHTPYVLCSTGWLCPCLLGLRGHTHALSLV